MKFTLLDRIVDLQPGQSITAVKALSLAEEYLQDHFPRFPVMPGVLMLEALYQAGAWLVHRSEDFAHSMVELKEARNIRYADFVEPGQVLTVTAEIVSQDESITKLKAQGHVAGEAAVNGKLVLHRYNLSDQNPQDASIDEVTRGILRKRFDVLFHPRSSLETVS